MTAVSYAQNFEDVMLWRAFSSLPVGRYVDVGAQDPVVDSVSLWFYQNGWRGVHVEPDPGYARKLREARPEEVVIEAAVGSVSEMLFYSIDGTGLSTGSASIAAEHQKSGFSVVERRVSVVSLDSILGAQSNGEIHWLKIDVEGMEAAVIESWQVSQVRPWIVLVESTLPLSTDLSLEFHSPLVAKGYEHVYFDGLNRFYLSVEHPELREHFNRPPNVFDDFALSGMGSSRWSELVLAQLREKDAELAAASVVSQLAAEEATKRSDELLDRVTVLARERDEISAQKRAVERDLSNEKQILAEMRSEFHEARNALRTLNHENVSLLDMVGVAKEEAEISKARRLTVEKRLSKVRKELHRTRRSLNSVRRSRWWRLGSPIRAVVRFLHKR